MSLTSDPSAVRWAALSVRSAESAAIGRPVPGRAHGTRGPSVLLAWSLLTHAALLALLIWTTTARPSGPAAEVPQIEMLFEPPATATPVQAAGVPFEVPLASPELPSAPASQRPPAPLAAEPAPVTSATIPGPPEQNAASVPSAEPAPTPVMATALPVEEPVAAELPAVASPARAPSPSKTITRRVSLPIPAPRDKVATRSEPIAPSTSGPLREPTRSAAAETSVSRIVPAPASSAPAPAANAAAAIDPAWRRALGAWMAEHKGYPDAARSRGEAGAVGVTFTVARDGWVRAVLITSSSGSTLLDEAVTRSLAGRQVPAFTAAMLQSEVQVSVRIVYTLNP